MAVSKYSPKRLTQTKGSEVKYLKKNRNNYGSCEYFFAENLHAGRGAIDMKHIIQDFSLKAWIQSPGMDLGVGVKAKLIFF